MTAYRHRFGLKHDPLPRDACGKTCFTQGDGPARLERFFALLAADPGLGLLTGEAGVGKTTLMRHLSDQLPAPEHRVLYIADTNVTATAVYRNLAVALGLEPRRQRDALWRQLRDTIHNLVDREAVIPILVLDEAQHLPDDFLADLASFLNFAFDSRDLLTVWLVGLPSLRARLDLRVHAALRSRVIAPLTLAPRSRDELIAMIRHGLAAAGVRDKLLADPALEVLFRVSRGLPRLAHKLLRAALMLAHDRDQTFVDEQTVLDACDEIELQRPTREPEPPARRRKSR